MSPSPSLKDINDVLRANLKRQVEQDIDAFDAARRKYYRLFFGDPDYKPPPRTRWQRFMDDCALWRSRLGDAWLVLRGKAEIYDDR